MNYRPKHVATGARLPASCLLVLLAMCGACRPGTPVVDAGSKPASVDGTISGSVTGPNQSAPVSGRTVRATSIETGQTYEATTSNTGGYTMKVPPGRYKLDVQLLPGERLMKEPGETRVNASDLDPGRDFVIIGGSGGSGQR
jgi:hypothetical protein